MYRQKLVNFLALILKVLYNVRVGDDMEFNILRLKNGLDKYIDIDLTYSFNKEELKGTDLLSLDDVKIRGEITKNLMDEIMIHLNISGIMKLPCAITLEPVNHEFNIEIEDSVEELAGEIQEIIKKDENTLDILPIIWENILLEIPMRVVSSGAENKIDNLHGDGWKVITEENRDEINPELAKLKELL